ncbi:hypothetical protein [Nonomuraea jabiensis]|uniref:Uncharacterized protein n=1 Tax=Nonomuraea jabiensis TaxID=882448 RepID=A0A7W9GC50_9ACTN|nr:hypothetical protein [Nonomuraea jabiensis]MBB5781072.1 hypothetical protein [Nonomuraea jabiensis]
MLELFIAAKAAKVAADVTVRQAREQQSKKKKKKSTYGTTVRDAATQAGIREGFSHAHHALDEHQKRKHDQDDDRDRDNSGGDDSRGGDDGGDYGGGDYGGF